MDIERLIKEALDEDIGTGDITSEYFVPEDVRATGEIIAKERCVIFGAKVAESVFKYYDPKLEVTIILGDGARVRKGDVVMRIIGSARSILACERTALNFLGHLSGVATKTDLLVRSLGKSKVVLLDTRKTTPLLRALEKQAVVAGGGKNHRMGLYDRVLIKDNHISAVGGIERVLELVDRLKKEKKDEFVEVEVSSIRELKLALNHDVDCIMLDNFTPEMVKRAVRIRADAGKTNILFELSGGIDEKNIKKYARLGVEFISAGCITHSARSINFSLELRINENNKVK